MKKNTSIFLKKLIAGICAFSVIFTTIPTNGIGRVEAAGDENQVVYLSDIDYLSESFTEQKKISKDRNASNSLIQLVVGKNEDGSQIKRTFVKGVSAWANSEIVYDISKYNCDVFKVVIGVDASEQNDYYNSGVFFHISVSNDKVNWTERYKSSNLKGWDICEKVEIPITGFKYIQLRADKNGDTWYSHWYDNAVYADAKLVKNGYDDSEPEASGFIKTIEEYDELLNDYVYNDKPMDEAGKLLLLQREYVSRIGYEVLSSYYRINISYQKAIEWLMTSRENLEAYLEVNAGSRENYVESLKLLSTLLSMYENDFDDIVLKKMALALSLSHINGVTFWNEGSDISNRSQAIERYRIYKTLRADKRLNMDLFEKAGVAEMRIIMSNQLSDDQTEWLNWFAASQKGTQTEDYSNPDLDHRSYIKYNSKMDWNYNNPKYFTEDGQRYIEEKYHLSEHDVKSTVSKLWTVMEEGAVCGGQSKTGANLRGVYGYPSFVIGQPGHAAYFYQDYKGGKKQWFIGNSIYGWWKSEYGGNLLGWTSNYDGIRWAGATGPDKKYYTGSYLLLEQAAIDDAANLKTALEYVRLAKIAASKSRYDKAEAFYEKAIKVQSINIPAWVGLLDTYWNQKVDDEKYMALAERASNALMYYPLAMSDYLTLICNERFIKNAANNVLIDTTRKNALNTSTTATDENVPQSDVTRTIASNLLKENQKEMATFSLDGVNAGTIIFDESFTKGNTTNFYYSLTGVKVKEDGESYIDWNIRQDGIIKLTEDEINSLNEENGILVKVEGLVDSLAFNIPLTRAGKPQGIEVNDNDDVVYGVTNTMEWSLDEGRNWTYFGKAAPNLSGDVTVWIRNGATGHTLAGDEHVELRFTQSTDSDDKRYISATNIINVAGSSEDGKNRASNIVDGSVNSFWSSSKKIDFKRELRFEFDKSRFITAMDVYPCMSSTEGRPKTLKIYAIDSNGDVIQSIVELENIQKDNTDVLSVEFEKPVYTKYIALSVGDTYHKNPEEDYACLSLVKFYEDTTIDPSESKEYEPVRDEKDYSVLSEKEVFKNGSVRITEENGIKYITATDFRDLVISSFAENNTIINPSMRDVVSTMFTDENWEEPDEDEIKSGLLFHIINNVSCEFDLTYVVIVPKADEEINDDTEEDEGAEDNSGSNNGSGVDDSGVDKGPGIEDSGNDKDNINVSTNSVPKSITVKTGAQKGIYAVTNVKKREVYYKSLVGNSDKKISIPKTITIKGKKYKVTGIKDNAFKNKTKLQSVVIGDNIKVIGKNAFSGCKRLQSIKIGKNVVEIKANAFKGCTAVKTITLKKNVKKIGANAFYGNKKLTKLRIDSTKLTKKTIAKKAFKGINKNTTITVPKSRLAAYKKLFKSNGMPKGVRIIKK